MKIFLLEDDFSLNESIKDMLESENFIVDSFYDGKVALDNISVHISELPDSDAGVVPDTFAMRFSRV